MRAEFRGSRKHVLSWIESDDFLGELADLLGPHGAVLEPRPRMMPEGRTNPREARLERDGHRLLGTAVDWKALERWWLAYPGRANTPNWDLALACTIEGTPGLALFEAKAHHGELSSSSKALDKNASDRSRENHQRIGQAIDEARESMRVSVPGVAISRDDAYQLSNRIAVAWWLASQGIPVLLVYLGFLGDDSVGRPFRQPEEWREAFLRRCEPVFPTRALGRPIPTGRAAFKIVVASRPVPQGSTETE